MTRSLKAHIKPGTDLRSLSRLLKDSMKDDIIREDWKDHGLVLPRSGEYSQKVRITLKIERIKA